MDNIISIILKDMNTLEGKLIQIKKDSIEINKILKKTRNYLIASLIANLITTTLLIINLWR